MDRTIYLTFDFDWAKEDLILQLWDYLLKEDVKATFFVTNEFKELRPFYEEKRDRFEFGVHPNFTPLPKDAIYHYDFISNCECIFKEIIKLIPKAKTVRSHGLTTNTRILNLFKKYGFTRESNLYIPNSSGVKIEAWHHYNGLIRIPFLFEDDLYCEELRNGGYSGEQWKIEPFFLNEGLKVFNFHPIHYALNTDDMERYYRYRETNDVSNNVNNTNEFGTKIFLERLINYAKAEGYRFGTLNEISL